MKRPKEELDIHLPESRSFRMGMTPFSYDTTPQAREETYRLVREHTDLVRILFNEGIPWPEAFEDKPYHSNVEREINLSLNHLRKDQIVLLEITPIGGSKWRNELDYYWGEDRRMERPGRWKNKDFDDPEVITAYINYCRKMIRKFKPKFLTYGVEVNTLARENPPSFKKFVTMVEQVYETLREENPKLPLILTIQIEPFIEDKEKQTKDIMSIIPYTDYIAISSYPFTYKADSKELPENWLSQIAEFAPEKPFAIAETGFTAEDVVIKKYGINIPGSERRQADYVQFLLNKSNELKAKFVVWFCPVDYDLLWMRMENSWDEGLKLWRDIGLLNGKREARLSLAVWDAWLKLPLSFVGN